MTIKIKPTSTTATIEHNDSTILTVDSSGNLDVTNDLTVDTNTLHVDATNNRVGIGTSSPTQTLDIDGATMSITDQSSVIIDVSDAQYPFIGNKASSGDELVVGSFGDVIIHADWNGNTSQKIILKEGTNEHLVVDSNGTTTFGYTTNVKSIFTTGTTGSYLDIQHSSGAGNGYGYVRFLWNGSIIGQIKQNGTTAVSYNTTSDHRLKENNVNISDGITRVKQLNPYRFNFISESDRTVDGFFAHEVQSVVPEAVDGTHNEVDDDGNPVYQGIDQSKLVPLLTAALKEAITKIEDLEARVATLEGN